MPHERLSLPHHKQERDYTCTAACVRMVLAFHGLAIDEEEVAALLGTTVLGTEFRRLDEVERLGFTVSLFKGTLEDLRHLTADGSPCIVRVKTCHLKHYPLPPWVRHSLVVVGVTDRVVYYHDPAQDDEPASAAVANFEKAWQAGQCAVAVIKRVLR